MIEPPPVPFSGHRQRYYEPKQNPKVTARRELLHAVVDHPSFQTIAVPAMQHRLDSIKNQLVMGRHTPEEHALLQGEARLLQKLVTDAITYWSETGVAE